MADIVETRYGARRGGHAHQAGNMRRQTRPAIVEVRRKRGTRPLKRSIWGSIDISAVASEIDSATGDMPGNQQVDSRTQSKDVDNQQQPQMEQHMADPQEADAAQAVPQVASESERPEPKKRGPRVKRAKTDSEPKAAGRTRSPSKAAETGAAPIRAKRRVYPEAERARKLAQIEKSLSRGESVRSATSQAGISEQTYYQWKKAAAPASAGDDLKGLIALEAENERLKKLLADRLRKENAELKRKLGLT